MKSNLRMVAAQRDIWKASELQRMLADAGLVISAGKMSRLWSGRPLTVRLADLDIICEVLWTARPPTSSSRRRPASGRRPQPWRSKSSAAARSLTSAGRVARGRRYEHTRPAITTLGHPQLP